MGTDDVRNSCRIWFAASAMTPSESSGRRAELGASLGGGGDPALAADRVPCPTMQLRFVI